MADPALMAVLTGEADPVRLPVAVAEIDRALSGPVQWRLELEMGPHTDGWDAPSGLEALLTKGPVDVALTAEGSELAQLGRLFGLSTPRYGLLVAECIATRPQQIDPDPFRPRWRAHRHPDLAALIRVLKDVVTTPDPLQSLFADIAFPDAEKAVVLQAGESDWRFALRCLAEYGRLQENSDRAGVCVTGAQTGRGRDAWTVAAADLQTLRASGDLGARQTDADGLGLLTHLGFEGAPTRYAAETPAGALGGVSREMLRGAFDPKAFQDWIARDMPLATQSGEALYWRVRDRISASDRTANDQMRWVTEFSRAAPELRAPIAGPMLDRPEGNASWRGFGTVVDHDPHAEWIQVKLDGFEEGFDLVDARLTTAYSGYSGERGVHLTPELDTKVAVDWSGRFGESLACAGNVRHHRAAYPAPSVFLERTLTAETSDTLWEHMGPVTIRSDVEWSIDGGTTVSGAQPGEFTFNSAQLEMTGGIVKTGRG